MPMYACVYLFMLCFVPNLWWMNVWFEPKLGLDKITLGEPKCNKEWSLEAYECKSLRVGIGHELRRTLTPVTSRGTSLLMWSYGRDEKNPNKDQPGHTRDQRQNTCCGFLLAFM